MSLHVTQLDPIGARIDGVDPAFLLSDACDPAEIEAILERNGVLVFPELHMTDEQLVAFSKRFGEIVKLRSGNPDSNKEKDELFTVSLDPELNDALYMRSTFFWHIDGTTQDIPSKASFLSAKQLSEEGGDTMFASTHAAYDRLSDEEKERLADAKVVHSLVKAWLCFDPDADESVIARLSVVPPYVHPLVWNHRDGRKSLVLGVTASHIEGMDEAEGRAILDELLDRATAPGTYYRHQWKVGDLVVWDNRGVLHRVEPYSGESGRLMRRATLVGDEPIV